MRNRSNPARERGGDAGGHRSELSTELPELLTRISLAPSGASLTARFTPLRGRGSKADVHGKYRCDRGLEAAADTEYATSSPVENQIRFRASRTLRRFMCRGGEQSSPTAPANTGQNRKRAGPVAHVLISVVIWIESSCVHGRRRKRRMVRAALALPFVCIMCSVGVVGVRRRIFHPAFREQGELELRFGAVGVVGDRPRKAGRTTRLSNSGEPRGVPV